LPGYYDPWTVLGSFLIACLAGFVAFESVGHTRISHSPRLWVAMGGITLGLGIWSMHFIGMIAWRPPFELFYSVDRTLLSVLAAIAASWFALHIVTRNVSTASKAGSALLVGSGICAMHYLGMSALSFSAPVMWDPRWIVISFLIAVTASWMAIALLEKTGVGIKSFRRQLAASGIIGIAICGMHYSGMQAFMPTPGAVALALPGSVSGPVLARVGVGNALLLTLGLLIVLYRDKAVWIQAASDARLEAQLSAQQLERMAAVGKIAASVAHEINNPLEAVMNLLYLVEGGELAPSDREYLAMAQSELRRIAQITTHTLKFYRQQTSPMATSIPDLFESALMLFKNSLCTASISVEKEWPDQVPPIICREGEIRQVIANLISNAIDAMGKGGTLRVGIHPGEEGLKMHVADTGAGIEPAFRDKIMEPMFTTKGIGGTGLGLSLSAEIIKRHGGSLAFSTEHEGTITGTRFEFFLPYEPAEAVYFERDAVAPSRTA
jgi:NO-binding membrane sensor protein with MHYT domain